MTLSNSIEIQLMSPLWLWLLAPLWLYFIVWHSKIKTKHLQYSIADADNSAQNNFYHPLTHHLLADDSENMDKQTKPNVWITPLFWWQGFMFSALVIALSNPVLIGKRLPDPPPERDIVFLVDTSISMQLQDYSFNNQPIKRMDLLRNLLNEFSSKMAGEKISVIIFAEQPFILVPLTHDQTLIKRMLGRVTTTLAGRYTAVGDALLMALKEANKQSDRHQTFILFTDADDSRGKVTPIAAAKLVAESNIPVFTIAIGSSQKNNDEKIQGGLYQSVDLPLLKDIADITQGKSYQVHDSAAMQQALDSILKQRQNIAEPVPQYERKNLYIYPLLFGLFMLLILQLVRLLPISPISSVRSKKYKKLGGV